MPHTVRINALQNESMIVNTGDLDDEVKNVIHRTSFTEQDRQELNKIIPVNAENDDTLALKHPSSISR